MHPVPEAPSLATVADKVLDRGHVWLFEYVEGGPLRFQLESSGLIRFGDAVTEPADPDQLPPAFHAAIACVRENLDRDVLNANLEDDRDVTFVGTATFRKRIAYDWDRLPAFLGTDVWVGARDQFLPPDAVERIYESVGLEPITVIERERHTRDVTLADVTMPASAWYDGPAAGLFIRNKRGGRAVWKPDEPPPTTPPPSVTDLMRESPNERFRRLIEHGHPASVERLADRALTAWFREVPALRDADDEMIADLRSRLRQRAQRYLGRT